MSDNPLPMHMSVRAFPAYWVPRSLPDNIKGRQGAEKFAAELAAREGVKVCLSIPGEQDVWFDEKGMVVFRSATGRAEPRQE